MAGVPSLEDPLTASNRPGLPRIAYAGEDFHDLRARLLARMAEAFPQWNPQLAANAATPDFAVVFIELFSRMGAVLGAYADARANEAYLRTAMLPRSLIDLAQLIDYRLAPGASASALQVFLAKDGKKGRVPAGYKVEAPPVVFETLAALEVDAARNRLHLFGHDRSERLLRLASDTAARLDQAYPALKAAGQPIVLDEGTSRVALAVSSVTPSDGKAQVHWAPGQSTRDFAIADLTVRAGPKQTMRLRQAARADEIPLGTMVLPVANAAMFDAPVDNSLLAAVGLTAATIPHAVLVAAEAVLMPARVLASAVTAHPAGTITLHRGVTATLRRSSVRIYRGRLLGFVVNSTEAGATELPVYFASSTGVPQPGDLLLVAHAGGVELATLAGVSTTASVTGAVRSALLHLVQPILRPLTSPGRLATTAVIFSVAPADPAAAMTTVPPVVLGELAGVYGTGETVLELDRAYEELSAGAVVAATDGPRLLATTVLASESIDGKTRLTLPGELPRDTQVIRLAIYGPFKIAARIDGYNRSERTLQPGATQLELAELGSGLAPGASLVVAGGGRAEAARVSLVSEAGDRTLVSLARALEHAYPLGDTVVYGNAVPVTHGASAPEEVLGGGDPALGAQRFLLRRSPLAFLPDATAERGVRAAVEIFVGDERWTEVRSLAASSGSDRHYVLDIDEKERAFVQFGDGVFGAQPESGRDNIRARYRVGHGLAGNVAANRIAQMPQPLPFLQATFNGAAAGGGAERESPADARRAAKHRVRTLGRAVSLPDYADLALTFGGIAKARADWERQDGRRTILLTLAAAGGAAPSAELKEAIHAFFAARSPAGRLRIRDHRNVPVRLALEVAVRPNFLQDEVLRRLWQVLGAQDAGGVRGYFHFDSRELGEDLFLSSIYRLVETTRGVQNALATRFHVEGESLQVADRIAIPADALACGGEATDEARGVLSLRLSGGIA